MVVHAAMFWLLAQQPGSASDRGEKPERMRLAFIAPPPAPALVPPDRHSAQPSVLRAPRPASRPAPAPALPPTPTTSPVEPAAATLLTPGPEQLRQRGRQWVQAQAGAAFQPTLFSSRRAQLPGGDGRGVFRMKTPWSPARVVGIIGAAFGDRDPCPDIRSGVAGLLASTSDHDRELMHEELRREREYCRP
ncbi:MAG: hypothetical protein ABWY01_00925 [Pseudoxanthomonas sp.]